MRAPDFRGGGNGLRRFPFQLPNLGCDRCLGYAGAMSGGNDGPPDGQPQPGPKGKRRTDSAFDLWLQRGLHKIFDDVANEPIPDELRRLIDGDREP